MLTEAAGIPLSVEVGPASRHDMKLVAATLVQMMCASPVESKASKLCMDQGYDYEEVRRIAQFAGFEAVIQNRHEEKESKQRGQARR